MSTEPFPVADGPALRGHLRALTSSHRPLVTRLFLASIAATVVGLIGPRILGDIVQEALGRASVSRIDRLALLLLLCVLAQALLAQLGYLTAKRFGETALARSREGFVTHLLGLPSARIERAGTGDLVGRASRDVEGLRLTAQQGVPTMLNAGATALLTLVALFILSPLEGVTALVTTPLVILAVRRYLNRSMSAYLYTNSCYAQLADTLTATVEGSAAIEALRLGRTRIDAADTEIGASYRSELVTLGLRLRLFPVAEFALVAPVGLILLVGGYGYTRGWLDVAQITAGALYVQQLSVPVNQLMDWLDKIQTGGAALARLLGVGLVPAEGGGNAAPPAEHAELAASRVGFSYRPGHEILHDIDLTIRPGERLAVVGPSGAGKSTLGRLLAGISTPSRGQVTLGAVPLNRLSHEDLRRRAILVTQDQHVFVGTLRENLELARHGEGDKALWAALEAVAAAEWARALPDGLETRVGSGATELNPAQTQQLALARLVLADPDILVLDEATAALDPTSARDLERSLAGVLEGRTVISIAHRLNTAHDADRIAVIDGGRITELGTHDELLSAGGGYAALWRSWHGQS